MSAYVLFWKIKNPKIAYHEYFSSFWTSLQTFEFLSILPWLPMMHSRAWIRLCDVLIAIRTLLSGLQVVTSKQCNLWLRKSTNFFHVLVMKMASSEMSRRLWNSTNNSPCTAARSPKRNRKARSVCDLPLVIVFRNNFAYIIKWSTLTKICVAHIGAKFSKWWLIGALKSVSDSFKIPWLYSIEAHFKWKDVFASLPTGYGSDLQSSTDRCRWAVIFLDMSTSQIIQGFNHPRFVDCSWEWLDWSEQGVGITLTGKG